MSSFIKRAASHVYTVIAAVVILAAILLYARGVLAESQLSAALLAMFGTFLGALFAYRLNERREDIKLDNERKQELNRAIFVIGRQFNALKNLHRDMEPFKTDIERAFNCPALYPPEYAKVSIDFDKLGFLLAVDPTLVMEISVQEEGFYQAISCLKMRSDFHVNQLQPAIARYALNKQELSMHEIEAALGDYLSDRALNEAKIMYRLVPQIKESLLKLHVELFNAAKAMYPKAKFVRLEDSIDVPANNPKSQKQ